MKMPPNEQAGDKPRRLTWQLVWQFVKFGAVGVSNTLIAVAVGYVFIRIDPGLYLWGQVVGWAVSVANAFLWNNLFVFKNTGGGARKLLLRLLKTYAAYGATMLLSVALSYMEVTLWGLSESLTLVVNLPLTIPLNFVINKLWAFKR